MQLINPLELHSCRCHKPVAETFTFDSLCCTISSGTLLVSVPGVCAGPLCVLGEEQPDLTSSDG